MKPQTINKISETIKLHKEKGKKVVLVHGVFDILHIGHLYFLNEAKKLGDILIVGIESDKNTKIFKGNDRPINNQKIRMYTISQLKVVDHYFLIPPFKKYNSLIYTNLYKKLKPNIIATCVKAGKHGFLKKRDAEKTGILFKDIRSKYLDVSTTKIINGQI